MSFASMIFMEYLFWMTRCSDDDVELILLLTGFVRLLFASQHLLDFVEGFPFRLRYNKEHEDCAKNRQTRKEPESLSIAYE